MAGVSQDLRLPSRLPPLTSFCLQEDFHTLLLLSSLIFCLISEEVLDVNHCLFVLTHFPFLREIMKIFLAVYLMETSEGFYAKLSNGLQSDN